MNPVAPLMNSVKHHIGKACVLIVFLVSALSASAQKSPELDYLIRFSAAITPIQEKYIFEALQGHEPDLGVWVDGHNAEVKVRTHVRLELATIAAQLSQYGLHIILLVQLNSGLPNERSQDVASGAGLPQYIDTGNPGTDNANYEAAKAAWIVAHREHYESTTAPAEPE